MLREGRLPDDTRQLELSQSLIRLPKLLELIPCRGDEILLIGANDGDADAGRRAHARIEVQFAEPHGRRAGCGQCTDACGPLAVQRWRYDRLGLGWWIQNRSERVLELRLHADRPRRRGHIRRSEGAFQLERQSWKCRHAEPGCALVHRRLSHRERRRGRLDQRRQRLEITCVAGRELPVGVNG